MGHLLSFIDTKPPGPPLENPRPPLPPRSINASSKSALLVEDDESLLIHLKVPLQTQGYAVRTASNAEEGLRLFRDCAPFNVVVIDYYVPQCEEDKIDCLAPQIHGIQLALAIREINPTQGIIITALDFQSAAEVPRPAEAKNIPLLTDTGNGQLRSLLEKIEIDRAIQALSQTDLLRLQRFAHNLVRRLGRAAGERDADDLLQEALYRTLIGAEESRNGRHWNKNVTFVQHLAGAMRSIASVWKRQFKEKNTYLVSELSICDGEGQEHSPIENVPSGCASADAGLIEESEQDRVFRLLRDDPEATQVLRGLMDGLKKNEILLRYGLDEKRYAAAMRRIRVKLLGGKN